MKSVSIISIALAVMFYAAAGICGELSTSQSVEVNASPEQVWALIVDADNWAAWNPAVKKSKLKKGDGEQTGSVVEFTPIIGGKSAPKVKLKLEKSQKPNRHEFTAKAPGLKIVFGRTVTQKDGVTIVTSYETITGPGAVGFKAMYGQEGLDREHREWVHAIKKKLELTDDKGSDGK